MGTAQRETTAPEESSTDPIQIKQGATVPMRNIDGLSREQIAIVIHCKQPETLLFAALEKLEDGHFRIDRYSLDRLQDHARIIATSYQLPKVDLGMLGIPLLFEARAVDPKAWITMRTVDRWVHGSRSSLFVALVPDGDDPALVAPVTENHDGTYSAGNPGESDGGV